MTKFLRKHFLATLLFVITVGSLVWMFVVLEPSDMEKSGQWGDWIGGFTGVPVLTLLLAGFWQQRQELAMQREALEAQQEELKLQREAIQTQVLEMKNMSSFAALAQVKELVKSSIDSIGGDTDPTALEKLQRAFALSTRDRNFIISTDPALLTQLFSEYSAIQSKVTNFLTIINYAADMYCQHHSVSNLVKCNDPFEFLSKNREFLAATPYLCAYTGNIILLSTLVIEYKERIRAINLAGMIALSYASETGTYDLELLDQSYVKNMYAQVKSALILPAIARLPQISKKFDS